MELKDKTIEELKVIAYDLIMQQQQTIRNLDIVNNLINQKLEQFSQNGTNS